MVKTFSIAERNIIDIIRKQKYFWFNGDKYETKVIGKPVVSSGEPKTDIYFYANNLDNPEIVFEKKISFKKENFDFIENKISANRAKEIFGNDWQTIIINSLSPIKDRFLNKKLIFKVKNGNTEAGSFTLGWKFELLNKASGVLSAQMKMNERQAYNVYSGDSFSDDKRNARVENDVIPDSGVADTILLEGNYKNIEDIINNLIDIKLYAKEHSEIYFACKALNYRSFNDKYDGDRPLAVYVDWRVVDDKLVGRIVFDNPLMYGGTDVYNQLRKCLESLNIRTTNDVTRFNVDQNIILWS